MPRPWPCRSWLISTADDERLLAKQRDAHADAVILELEAGAHDKEAARRNARAALRDWDYGAKYRVLRINPWDSADAGRDLAACLPAAPDAVMLTKVAGADEVREADRALADLERSSDIAVGSTELVLMIERAAAIFRLDETAAASPRVRALCFGGGDYTAEIGTRVTVGTSLPVVPGLEILVPRSLVVAAARTVGASPIDVPLGNVHDSANMLVHGYQSRALGFDGMIVVSPTQIEPVHLAFTPTEHEVMRARRVVSEFEAGVAAGRGVVGVDGEMVSETIAEWYRDTLRRAGVG